MRRRPLWRRPDHEGDQVANAHDDLIDLTPASEAPAEAVRAAWAAFPTERREPTRRRQRHASGTVHD